VFKYFFDSRTTPFKTQANRGIDEAEHILRSMVEEGQVQMVETGTWNQEQRFEAYLDVVVVAVRKKSAVRKVYGTNRYPAVSFGKGVPSLIIYNDSTGHSTDVYPRMVNGQVVTIKEYLGKLKETELVPNR